jgi:hypothetical protein
MKNSTGSQMSSPAKGHKRRNTEFTLLPGLLTIKAHRRHF